MAKHQQDTRVVVDGKRGAIEQRTSTEEIFYPLLRNYLNLKILTALLLTGLRAELKRSKMLV